MATRGTYKVDGKLLYNHWDNYPSGAARHFLNILKTQGSLSLKSFLKCDEGCNFDFTNSIFDGPAEWHYVIEDEGKGSYGVEVYKIIMDESGKDKKVFKNYYELQDFININFPQNFTEPMGEDRNEIEENVVVKVVSKYSNNVRYSTRKDLEKELQIKLNTAQMQLLNGHTGNASYTYSEASQLMVALEKDILIKSYNKNIAPMLFKAYGHEGDVSSAFLIEV